MGDIIGTLVYLLFVWLIVEIILEVLYDRRNR